jgi:hypothetical protein
MKGIGDMFRSIGFAATFILLVFQTTPVLAVCVGPLVGDRPDFTESAETVVGCRLQLESGYTLSRDVGTSEHSVGEVLARVYLAETVELRLGLNSYLLTSGETGGDFSGLDDSVVGFKVRLPSDWSNQLPTRPMAAVIIESSLPTGGADYTAEAVQPVVKLALAWELSEKAELASNLNLAYLSDGSERFGQLGGSLALGLEVIERIGWYAEFFSFLPGSKDGDSEHFFNSGLTFLVSDCLQLDVRLGSSLNEASPDFFAGVGFIRRW